MFCGFVQIFFNFFSLLEIFLILTDVSISQSNNFLVIFFWKFLGFFGKKIDLLEMFLLVSIISIVCVAKLSDVQRNLIQGVSIKMWLYWASSINMLISLVKTTV